MYVFQQHIVNHTYDMTGQYECSLCMGILAMDVSMANYVSDGIWLVLVFEAVQFTRAGDLVCTYQVIVTIQVLVIAVN